MTDIFRTMIVPEANVALARAIADMYAGSPQDMWQRGLSHDGQEPATHYISTGGVPEGYQVIAPWQVWEWDATADAWEMTDSYPGQPDVVYAACQEAGIPCTLADVQALFQDADMTAQDPYVAIGRLGLQLIQVPEVV